MTGPQRFLDHLAATVVLRQVVALAELAPTLTDAQLRDRLLALTRCAP